MPRQPPVTITTWLSKRNSSIGRAFWHSCRSTRDAADQGNDVGLDKRVTIDDVVATVRAGMTVGVLCRAGKVREVVYAFVSLDSIALEPHFRNARQAGVIDTMELDEGMFLL